MLRYKIFLVEDEENLLDVIRLNLELEDYEVDSFRDGKSAVENFIPAKYNLVILDVMLPELNGFDVCRAIRRKDQTVPILFLTAKNSSEDRVTGLKIGADDYLAKPFNLEELLLRVKNLIKLGSLKTDKTELDSYRFDGNYINFSTYEIIGSNGQKNTLSKKEVLLLKLLIERKNEVVSRDEILEKVWGADAFPSSRTIDNYILAFRKYFETKEVDESPKRHFHSIRGVGYKFTD